VLIRGEDVGNPPLIVLHGGRGMSEMVFFRRYNAALERYFTVVRWDQRGTGKSFDRDIPRSSMTLEQFVADLDELVDIVRQRFGKETVAILGHSWGSALGAIYASRFPANVSVYIGVAFFDALAAPSKQRVWFERSGHEAFVDEPEKFNSTMVALVRPLV
jgi:pimeloyl-ACP methyl ester carboxylesterase